MSTLSVSRLLILCILLPTSCAIAQLKQALQSRIPNHTVTAPTAPSSDIETTKGRVLPIEAFGRTSSSVGWAASDHTLLRTTNDGRTWVDITPPSSHRISLIPGHDEIASAFFSTAESGALVSTYQASAGSDTWLLELSTTHDGGRSWSTTPLTLPNILQSQPSGQVRLYFLDSRHAWIDIALKSSSAFQLGSTYTTDDGGAHWQPLPGDPGLFGAICELSLTTGWLVAHDGHDLLAIGGGSAHEVILRCPSNLDCSTQAKYSIPVFEDAAHGFEAVTYLTHDHESTLTVLFTTQNGGRTWMARSKLSGGSIIQTDPPHQTSVVDGTWIISLLRGNERPKIMQVRRTLSPSTSLTTGYEEVKQQNFISPANGWLYTRGQLLATDDAGSSWEDITPMLIGSKGT